MSGRGHEPWGHAHPPVRNERNGAERRPPAGQDVFYLFLPNNRPQDLPRPLAAPTPIVALLPGRHGGTVTEL
jgi:hypothetical protein